MALPPFTGWAQAPASSPLTPLPATPSLVASAARWPATSSQQALTELASSSLHVPDLPSSSSYVADTSLLSIDPKCSPLAATPMTATTGGRRPSSAAVPVKLETSDGSLTDQFDQAYLRYQVALDAIAERYSKPDSDAEGSESSGIDLVEPDELVELFTRRRVKDEPLSDDDGQSASEAGGSEADEVDEDDALDGPAPDAREELLLTRPAGRRSGSRRASRDDGVFRQDGNPTWCWVEDTPSTPPPGLPSSSLVFTLLLQQGASLTASLAHATHVLLALPPGPVADPAALSALHRSILLGDVQTEGRFVLSAEWVRDCARTGIRLREAGYSISLQPAAASVPPTPRSAVGLPQALETPAKHRQRSGPDGQRRTPRGVSRLKVYFSAPDRLDRPTKTASASTSVLDLHIPAFKTPQALAPSPPPAPPREPLRSTSRPPQPASPGPSKSATIKPEPRSPATLRLSAKAAGKQRAPAPPSAKHVKPIANRQPAAQDVKPAVGANNLPPASRLPGAGLSKRSRVPKLLSEIRPPPPPLPMPPRPKPTRAKQEQGCSDDQDASSPPRSQRKLKKTSSECYG